MNTGLPAVLACGAWLKNAACLLEQGEPHWSPVHGDLGDPAACAALDRSLDALRAGARTGIAAVAHDLHPDFYSTQRAHALAAHLGVPAIGVQHHHAHIAAVMAEHGIAGPVIGLALDGVGLGSDGGAWGGELLWVAPQGWRRLGSLWPLRLAGGDIAAREPWRMAAAALHALGRNDEIESRFAPVVGAQAARVVGRMLEGGLNSPATSSTGRWFDAAAGALGLSVRQSHEAEAAIALEQAATRWRGGEVSTDGLFALGADGRLDLRPALAALLDRRFPAVEQAAAAFHAALADGLAQWALSAARAHGCDTVCLGGGCFMNALLSARVARVLQQGGLRVLRPQAASCGDAGLALGQAWAVAQQLHAGHCTTPDHTGPHHIEEMRACA
ncbi:Kae1-like domain-containing protein [Methyloversatilis thermotolerans]|uniref:Kae1-like domain-containing protein n=1 Tax=Methyloversatilis thermotolerans TaxID=1346290 RepID=UPI00039D3EBA|nr:carbamoyltransferase HypF [Methyloversatilis thermotolerans]